MVFETPINNVVIDGNTFDYGTYTPDGNPASSPIVYSYFYCVTTTLDTTITNNYFSGIAKPSLAGVPSIIDIGSGSNIIKNNIFNRSASTIYAYIVCNSTNDQIITDNIFDGYTVDGLTDENLIKGVNLTATGLSVGSTYNNNKNQTGYSMIPVLVGEKLWSESSTGPYNEDPLSPPFISPSTFGGAGANQTTAAAMYASLTLQDTTQHGYFRTYDIAKIVPINTQILEVKQGVYAPPSGDTIDTGTSEIVISIASGVTDYDVTGYSSMLDVQLQLGLNLGVADSQTTTLSGPGLLAIQSGTYYLTIDSAIQNNSQYYFNTLQSALTISIGYVFLLSNWVAGTGIIFSPIRIKYRW